MKDLKEFKNEMIDLVWQFEAYWLSNHKVSPEDFPMDMPAVEWHEQFIVWSSLEGEE